MSSPFLQLCSFLLTKLFLSAILSNRKGVKPLTLGERIKKVRKELDLTQQAFAAEIGSTQNALTGYETGRRNPSAAALNNICKTFNISETWLRTGDGEMFIQQSKEDELKTAVDKLLSGETSEFKQRLVKVLASLKEEQWVFLEEKLEEILGAKAQVQEPEPLTIEQEARAEAERYYQELVKEKKLALQASSAKESDVG